MTAGAAGITVCLFAYSLLSFDYQGTDVFARHFHGLVRDFASGACRISADFSRPSTKPKRSADPPGGGRCSCGFSPPPPFFFILTALDSL